MKKGLSLLIDRYDDSGTQTLGKLYILENGYKSIFNCDTLELPWKNNNTQVSCIPLGEYVVVKRWSPARGNHLHILDVPGRTWVLIHAGNYHTDILGCVLVGSDLKDLNKDGELDVINSRITLNKILNILPSQVKLEIVGVNKEIKP